MSRFPHTVKLPEVVWLGMTAGQWPIAAFGTEEQAAFWANQDDGEGRQRYVWRVEVPADAPVYKPRYVPAQHVLVRFGDEREATP